MSDLIKWTGSKESQAQAIISAFPTGRIDTYFEPFLGGGAVFLNLVSDHSNLIRSVNRFYISDANKELVGIWQLIKEDPAQLGAAYAEHHKRYNLTLGTDYDTCLNRQRYFKSVRAEFNAHRRPADLFFLVRTAINGLIRYNGKGQFNSACHFNRPGMSVDEVTAGICRYNRLLQLLPVEIQHHSYDQISPGKNDVVYLDPPYENSVGLYHGGFDNHRFLQWLEALSGTHWFLSYDGSVNGREAAHAEPAHYLRKIMLSSGQSQFRKVLNSESDTAVLESLYIGGIGKDPPLPSLFDGD